MSTTPATTAAAPAAGGALTGASPAAHASASLYVGDLLPDVTEALLFETFNAVGPVASVRVCRDAATRRSLGYAYVNFHRADDAERALDTMNFKPIRGKQCRIMWSHRDPSLRKSGQGNIFVKNLAKSIDNKQLYDTFSVFGNILSCKVAMSVKGASVGYGFVHYETDEAAANAIARVNGKSIAGETVIVAAFKSKKERGGVNKTKFTNLYVKRLPADYSEGQLRELFAKYGTVDSIMLAAESKAPRPKRAAGESKAAEPVATPEKFGFVNFAAPEQAMAAIDGLNNFEIAPGKHLFVGRAQKREEREKELRERFEQLKMERQKKYAGVNLYVKNLADDVEDTRLRDEFAKFGSISSARVMKDDATKKSRGFGFVCFSTPEEATKAVTEMNGRMLDGKPLYVALAQRKDARRAQLEARHAARAKGMMGQPGPQMGYPPQGPMFYQQPRGGATYMYPGPMGRGGWMGPMGPGPMGVNRGPGMAYQLMPVQGQNGGRGGPQGGPQGPHGAAGSPQGRPRGPMGPQGGMPQGGRPQGQPQGGRGGGRGLQPATAPQPQGVPQQTGPAGQPGVRFNDNVRNPAARPAAAAASSDAPEPAVGATPVAGTAPLTLKALAAAPEKQKKQLIGEQLFPLIKAREPVLAGKITGMLLEMDNHELINLLESPAALQEKITEAMAVLQAHEAAEEGEEEETE